MLSEENPLPEDEDAYFSEKDNELLEGFDQEGMEEQFTKAQLLELQQVIKMNQKKNKTSEEIEIMTKEMKKKIKKSLKKNMEKLDDFEGIN